MKSKAQVTIFIIIAIVIVAAVIGFFLIRGIPKIEKIPVSIEPVYNTFLFCLEDDALVGIDILESQGGYIELPEFEPGSTYMPFSSQLDFLGNPVPYWYYVSGNNIQKEQIPSKNSMQNQLADYVESEIKDCIFANYYEQGFEIKQGNPEANVMINDNDVNVELSMPLSISKGEESSIIENHKIIVKSQLGKLYNNAKKVYDYEQSNLFLESYAVDTLRLYAPVDGVEITCSPKTWNADEVFNDLQEAVEVNTQSLKAKSGDYTLKKDEDKYFLVDLPIDSGINVRFLNSRNWANAFEVTPSEGNMLISTPVGNQPGLGVLGFCYVPYHFVYSMKYPILVQIYSEDEMFQFPLAVIIQRNVPREPLEGSSVYEGDLEICKYKNTSIKVNIFDSNINPVDADISFECLNSRCYLGKSKSGVFEGTFPQCFNGKIVAESEGFLDSESIISSIDPSEVDIFMDRLYNLDVNLKLDGKEYPGQAVISFISEDSTKTIVYPEQKNIQLSGSQKGFTGAEYEIQVYIYKNSSISIPATKTEQCTDVPTGGIGGFFGMTKEECFEIDIPQQIVSNSLSGGGKENYYILESELQSSKTIEINVQSLPVPTSIEDLQNNYILHEKQGLDILFI